MSPTLTRARLLTALLVLVAVAAVSSLVTVLLTGSDDDGGGGSGGGATLRDGVTLVGSPIVVDASHGLVCATPGACTLRPADGFTGDMVTTSGGQASTAHHPHIRIDGVRIDCAGKAYRGIFLRAPDDLSISRTEVTGCRSHAELEGALQVRGNGTNDLTQGMRFTDIDVHDNAGNGMSVGYGVRAGTYSSIRADHNGLDGLVVDGSEGTLTDVRARSNGGSGVFFRNLIAISAEGVVAVGNHTGVRAISLVGARLDVVAQNNDTDVWFDDTLLGGCETGVTAGCTTNYGHTRDVLVTGVAGPSDFKMSGESARPGEVPLRVDPSSEPDTTGLLIAEQ